MTVSRTKDVSASHGGQEEHVLFPAELSVSERLASLESVFFSAPIGLCSLDLDFRYITVNERFARLYRRPASYFIGKTVQEALPGPAAQIIAHLKRALEVDGIVEAEIKLEHHESGTDPSEFTYLRSAQPVRDPAGTIVGLAVALSDITERKQMEAALRESEENLRYTVELTPHIPWTADVAGELTFMSQRWHEITGSRPEPAMLKNWIRAVHLDDRDATLAAWMESVESGKPYDRDYRVKCVGGVWRWHRARAYPRRNGHGEIVLWYGTLEDIHDRKTAEEALEAKTQRLEEITKVLDRLAREDHLTGVANRRTFDEILDSEIERARRSKLPLGLVILDVDDFKQFNDTHGHSAGDEVLRAVAQALDGVIHRTSDLAARFGGEEFVLVLPNTTEEGALLIARKANDTVRALRFQHGSEDLPGVTISAGLAMLDLSDGADTDTVALRLINAADKALYEAKASGRDRIVLARG